MTFFFDFLSSFFAKAASSPTWNASTAPTKYVMKLADTPSFRTALTRAFTSIPGRSVETLVKSLSCVTALATRLRSAVAVKTRFAVAFVFFFIVKRLVPFDGASSSRSAPVSTTSSVEPRHSARPCGAALRGRNPGGAFVNPKDSTYPWSSAEVTSAGTLTPSRRCASGATPRTTEETRVVRSIRLPPLLPFSSRRTAHRTIWPTKNAAVRDSGGSPPNAPANARSESSESENESDEASSDEASSDEASSSESSSSPFPSSFFFFFFFFFLAVFASALRSSRARSSANASAASARVTVPLSPFGSDTCIPRSVTSVTTPRSFMPTRRVLCLSDSTKCFSLDAVGTRAWPKGIESSSNAPPVLRRLPVFSRSWLRSERAPRGKSPPPSPPRGNADSSSSASRLPIVLRRGSQTPRALERAGPCAVAGRRGRAAKRRRPSAVLAATGAEATKIRRAARGSFAAEKVLFAFRFSKLLLTWTFCGCQRRVSFRSAKALIIVPFAAIARRAIGRPCRALALTTARWGRTTTGRTTSPSRTCSA